MGAIVKQTNLAAGGQRPRLGAWLCLALALFLALPDRGAEGANQELVPGSRLVFPYYDLRPGSLTFLFFTNVSLFSASISLEFYDVTCIRQDTSLSLTPGDVSQLDVGATLTRDPSGAFQQGFVDSSTVNGDILLGKALIVNIDADWAIEYQAAATQRVAGGAFAFEPYPSRLFLPAFLTPGQLGPSGVTDGLLIVAAPHPTTPGGELQEEPILAALTLFLENGRRSSAGVSGHYVIVPIGQIVGSSQPAGILGWLDLVNRAFDESGNPIGVVGLYIQTVVGPNVGIGMATRLWGAPSPPPGP